SLKLNINTRLDKLIEILAETHAPVAFLYPEEIVAMLQAATQATHRLIVRILFDTGMRVNELTALRTLQVDFENRQAIVTGKGQKTRVVWFTEGTGELLRAH